MTGDLECPANEGEYESGDVVLVTDVRFQNEYEWVIQNGGRVLVIKRPERSGNVGIAGHASESGITSTYPERTWLIENNSTLENLYSQLDTFAQHIGLDLKDDPFPL